MNLENLTWMLTALAAVVVLLTRMRLSAVEQQAGHAQIPQSTVNAHTIIGVVALAVWVYYLTAPNDLVGLLALVAWWSEAVIGVLILARWLPGGGRHSAGATDDNWAQGPALSILGHVGLVLGSAYFTFYVLSGQIT